MIIIYAILFLYITAAKQKSQKDGKNEKEIDDRIKE